MPLTIVGLAHVVGDAPWFPMIGHFAWWRGTIPGVWIPVKPTVGQMIACHSKFKHCQIIDKAVQREHRKIWNQPKTKFA
jgi:hypothetical protein